MTTVQSISAVVQIVLALVLVYIGLSIVKMGYDNIQDVRGSPGAAVTDGGQSDD